MTPVRRVPRRLARRLARLARLAILAAVLGLVAAACSSAPAASQPGLTISDAWARPAAAAGQSAAYLTIANAGAADTLLSVRCSVAGSTMIHQTSTDASGMTGMSPIDKLPIPAGTTVTLKPGGYHVMMMGLTQALAAGATLELRLVFEHAGEVPVSAAIRPG
jgi:copper(I)-binding protein